MRFQALYFEKYYIGKKENKLEKSLSSFEEFLSIPRTNEAIINFINDTKKSDNIALAYRDLSLRNGFSLETYMGQRQIVIKDYENDKEYKVILGDQFPKIKIKKGDTVQVYGVINEFGYLFTESIMINGNAISPYYNIIPSETLDTQKSILALPSYEVPIGEDNYIEGSIEYVIPEDNSYYILSNADLFLDYEVRSNIFSKSKYTTKANALNNAIKYTPDGGKINVLIKLNEEDQCVFEIENFGVTLTKEEIEKIWDPFYRKEQSRNKRFGGTGLGLSIVKRILEVHHSNFGVESTENSVKFYFTIQKCMAY